MIYGRDVPSARRTCEAHDASILPEFIQASCGSRASIAVLSEAGRGRTIFGSQLLMLSCNCETDLWSKQFHPMVSRP